MSVLAEGFSVVVPVSVLGRAYPGGIGGFERDVAGYGYCTDGVLSRVGFRARREADAFIGQLAASGLASFERGVLVDVALLHERVGPLAPCLWLEYGRERCGTPVCWHAAARRGVLHAPVGWAVAQALLHTRFIGRPFVEQLRYLRGGVCGDETADRLAGRADPQAPSFH